jgi:hypothetical protein
MRCSGEWIHSIQVVWIEVGRVTRAVLTAVCKGFRIAVVWIDVGRSKLQDLNGCKYMSFCTVLGVRRAQIRFLSGCGYTAVSPTRPVGGGGVRAHPPQGLGAAGLVPDIRVRPRALVPKDRRACAGHRPLLPRLL